MIEFASLKKLLGPRFICHPNKIVLKLLNQKPCPQKESSSSSSAAAAAATTEKEKEMETEKEMEISMATRCGNIIRVLDQISISSSSMVMETETKKTEPKTKTDQNGAKQRVKQLKHVK